MPDQVIPVTGLDTVGLIEDMPPVSLPPNAFSDCRNVRFRDGSAQKMRGDIDIFPNVIYDNTDVLKYVVWWPNPNLAVDNQGYYLLIITRGTNDIAYMIKADQAPNPTDIRSTNIPEYKGTFLPNGNWQHTFFQGGFALIINNGLEAPHYVLDGEDNTDVANVGGNDGSTVFDPLPGWASYAVDGTGVGTVTAGIIRTYGDLLIAGNLVERDDDGIIRALPNTIRTSDIAAPGAIPQNWNPFAEGVNTADEFVVTGDGIVQDFAELQGNMYVYSNSSISVVSRTGNPVTPISVRPVTSAYGALTTDSVIEFDGRHFVVGSRDIYLFGGHPGSIQSVSEDKVRDYFYNSVNNNSLDNIFVLRYQPYDEIWLCYPSQTSEDGRANEALIWNYRKNTWTKRDINGAFAGVIGPAPGGGIPRAGFLLEGNGNDNEIVPGETHQVTLSDVSAFDMTTTGNPHVEVMTVDVTTPYTIDPVLSNLPKYLVTLGENFYTGSGTDDRPTIRFVAELEDASGEVLAESTISLPPGLGQNAAYGSEEYRLLVLEPIIETITDGLVDQSRISIRRVETGDYRNISFIIDFPYEGTGKINGRVQMYAPAEINSIRDVTSADRPLSDDGFITDEYDVIGDILPLSSGPDSWGTPATVFSFDFRHIQEDIYAVRDNALDDYVFFLVGSPTGLDNPPYVPLPAGTKVYRGSGFVMESDEPALDGGDATVMDGDVPMDDADDTDDGGRLQNVLFTRTAEFEVDITKPLRTADIQMIAEVEDTIEIALLVDSDDFEALNLVAYRARNGSDGVTDYDRNSPCIAIEEGCGLYARVTIDEIAYNKDVLDYEPRKELASLVAAVTLTATSVAGQIQEILSSLNFAAKELEGSTFNRTLETSTLTLTSIDNQAYSFILDSEELASSISTDTTTLGQVQVGGVDGDPYVAPCIRVFHSDPNGITYFDFQTDLIRLTGATDTDVENDIIFGILDSAPQWEYDNNIFQSRAVKYDESNGDMGVPFPQENGTYQFNENREHGEFIIEFYEGNIAANAAKIPTLELTRSGIYDSFDGEGWGSYFVINMSNEVTYLFYLGDTTRSAVDQLREQIAARIPGVELTVENGFASILPTVVGDNTIFVREAYMNFESSIEDFRRLLSAPFIQDVDNPQLPESLPDAVLNPQAEIDFPFTIGNEPFISNLSITTEFDFDRAWSAGAVNFAVEYPIFAAGKVLPDGASSNAVLASEIGYAFPTFGRGQITYDPYESFVEREQLAMAPEFTTERVKSVALWADGSTRTSFPDGVRYNALQIDLSTSDNPGQLVDLDNAQFSNMFYISEDYKMDLRLTGRFLNWKLSDQTATEIESPGGKTFSQQTDWRVSGIQWNIRAAGRR